MSEHADYRSEAEDYAARCPAEPATGDDIIGAEGALVISIPAAKYPAGKTATARDADLTAGNIKDGVDIFGVEGSFEGAGGLAIKSIQQGETAITDGNNNGYTTITAVDLTKSVLLYLGCRSNQSYSNESAVRMRLESSTSVKANRKTGTGITLGKWVVLEFTEGIELIQRVAISTPYEGVTADLTITAVDLNKTVLIYGGCATDDPDADGAYCTIELIDSTTLRITRLGTLGSAGIWCEVLEFE